ncbi:hypothetical protein AcV5_001254 [Taiwanofungus camphoratus]|nr:hypothetical protein AcV5_001254 [Antrodia cinnamomea]
MQTFFLGALSLFLLYCVKKYFDFRTVVNSIQDFAGYRAIFGIENFLFQKRIPFIAPGKITPWTTKHQDFVKYNSDVISAVNVWPRTNMTYLVADADVLKEITGARARFPKWLYQYKILTFYGSNIVVTEDDEWKRQRKITAPAFSERNNRLVWDETVRIVMDLCNDVWRGQDEIVIDNIVDLTVPASHLRRRYVSVFWHFSRPAFFQMALFVIGVAGFGRRMSWKADLSVPRGHVMPFKDALHTVSTDLWLKVVAPKWMLDWGITKRLKNFNVAYQELERYMEEMIQTRKGAEKKEERYDLFSSLLDANEDELDGKTKLSDSELMGNIFIFLIAGHETTAHTLAFAFIMLALYQDEQEKLYRHIKSVLPDDRIPAYEEMGQLTYSMAVFLETLRLFPPVIVIPKEAVEDTTLVTRNQADEPVSVPVPQGTILLIHTPGLHYNPRYWEEPYAFKPERFLGDWPRDAFLPFSGGARSCLGRRFSETEGVAILTYLVAHYRIDVKEEPQFAGETFEERKERLLACKTAITLYPVKSPLVFRRR